MIGEAQRPLWGPNDNIKMSKKEVKEAFNEIVEFISYTGYMGLSEKDLPKYSKAIPKLIAHKVIVVGSIANPGRKSEVVLKGGENFLKANLKGGYNYIREVESEINPTRLMKTWNYISTNPLLSNFVAGLLGGVIGGALLNHFTQ